MDSRIFLLATEFLNLLAHQGGNENCPVVCSIVGVPYPVLSFDAACVLLFCGKSLVAAAYFRIYLDNARYQHATLLKEWMAQTKKDKGVTFDLKHLPAYSPNLNLIERLWKFLRKEALQRWHPTFEDMQKAVADVLDNLPRYHTQLDTLMTERFHLTPVASTIIVGMGKATKQVA